MVRLLLDPCLLGMREDASAETLTAFVDGLLAWRSALDEGVDVLMSRDCRDLLADENLYPTATRLRSLFHLHRPSGSSWFDVVKVVERLYRQVHELEAEVCCALEYDEPTVELVPAEVRTRLPGSLGAALQRSLVDVAFWQLHLKGDAGEILFAAAPGIALPDENGLQISAKIADYAADCRPCEPPMDLQESIAVRFGYEEVWNRLELTAIWGWAESSDSVRRAIQQRMQQYIDQGTATNDDRVSFELGDHFLETVRTEGITISRASIVDKLLDVIGSLLVRQPIKPPIEFRVSENSNKQLTRGQGDRAFRMHITEPKEGYRLMYWVRLDNTIELSAVRTKWVVRM